MDIGGAALPVPDEALARELSDESFHLETQQRDGNRRTREATVADDFINAAFVVAPEQVEHILFTLGKFQRGQHAGFADILF